ncbi:MAG: GNAT family N-acetyltransferase [Hyphomicrobiales bacterium]|nr:MAG: GNAT family N-acetyltransferase [Hyphomicrobiales bacterium]
MSLTIRPARAGDAGLILALIRELADYEKLAHEVVCDEAMLEASLFGDTPRVFSDIAEWDGEPAGFVLWFYNYSTFLGRHGLYLEDLFVRPSHRRYGIGTSLLKHLAQRCVDEGLGRFEWSVLDWNAPARDFYKVLGADSMDEWIGQRVTGEALAKLAGGKS